MGITEQARLADASIADVDPDLWAAMEGERRRQHDKIELIASENYTAAAVMEAQGSWLTNKYAEGLPGKRYYGGCEFVDVAEELARERALKLFPGAEHVNVQPHSGAQANMAAYFSVIEPGDRILGMKLDQGGHLTHGMKLNFSGRLYEVHAYGVRQDTERIDYDALEAQAAEVRPKLIVAGASAYPRTWDFERMAAIAHGVGAMIFSRFDLPDAVDAANFPNVKAGPSGEHALAATIDRTVFPGVQGGPLMQVIAGKAVAFQLALGEEFRRDQQRTIDNAATIAAVLAERGLRVVSGGTDNHLMLVDVMSQGVTGKDAEHFLDEIGVTVNKNQIPFDRQPPNTSSGIRVGTPAVTSRGMGEPEMREIASIIADAIDRRDDPAAPPALAARVAAIAGRFPVPGLARPA